MLEINIMENIKDLKLGITPEAAISGAVLLQTEYSTFLTFNAQKETDKPSPYGRNYTEDAGTAITEFPSCLISKFGHPNDDAAMRIPKYQELGYDICEVHESTWIKELARRYTLNFDH